MKLCAVQMVLIFDGTNGNTNPWYGYTQAHLLFQWMHSSMRMYVIIFYRSESGRKCLNNNRFQPKYDHEYKHIYSNAHSLNDMHLYNVDR